MLEPIWNENTLINRVSVFQIVDDQKYKYWQLWLINNYNSNK